MVSSSLNSYVLACSDEFFAQASNLLNPRPPIHKPGYYVATGAWYDGWETRRHNESDYDWVIIRLGVSSGKIEGVEVDTAYFVGNHACAISLDGCFQSGEGADRRILDSNFAGWHEVLGKRDCGASRRQAWLPNTEGADVQGQAYTHVRLRMYPDGGIARFRLYGQAVPVWPADMKECVEVSAAVMGGVAVKCSDQHFGSMENLLIPGRGTDMGDGWETKRSRGEEHVDWVIIRLGARSKVKSIVVDTAHFRGNYPRAVMVQGIDVAGDKVPEHEDRGWVEVLGSQKTGPDTEHEYGEGYINDLPDQTFTHMKLIIIPDGGVKRFRVFGTRA